MIRVTANEYLDRRRPEWLDAEVGGSVRFDWHPAMLTGSRLVEISDSRKDIQAACGGAVHRGEVSPLLATRPHGFGGALA